MRLILSCSSDKHLIVDKMLKRNKFSMTTKIRRLVLFEILQIVTIYSVALACMVSDSVYLSRFGEAIVFLGTMYLCESFVTTLELIHKILIGHPL